MQVKWMNRLSGALAPFALLAWLTPASAFEPEPLMQINPLPAELPDHWILVRDFDAPLMSLDGRILLVDPLGERLADQIKGMMPASAIAALEVSHKRNEYYVIESFYERGGRGGKRTDVVTIWDPQTLSVLDEVVIPTGRFTGMPKRTATGLVADDRFLAIYNFTLSQSVSIVDLEKREFVTRFATGGCALVVPNGERSFTSICSNGALRTSHLNPDGTLEGTTVTGVLFDPHADPIFESPAFVDGVAYFASYTGQVLAVDTRNDKISSAPPWPLAQNEAEASWRPGGANQIVEDSAGMGYVLMHPDGAEGTHDNGGSEVWIYDLAAGKRIQRLQMKNWTLALGTTGSGDQRYLFARNIEPVIDLYHMPSGEHVKSLDLNATEPMLFHGLAP